MNYDILIIGGGASGLACAVRLLKSGNKLRVGLIDAGERFGKKLSATGNGQGNISNLDMSCGHYHGGNIALVERIACSDPYAGTELFDCLFEADEKGRIYPSGRQASALVDSLNKNICLSGITARILNCKITRLNKTGDVFEVSDGVKQHETAKYVVLCTGGKAQKQFRTDGSSYSLAQKFGHKLTPLYPSLVQLKTETKYIRTLKGIRADCVVSAYADGQLLKKVRGDVIFTDYGVSGNAVFSISSYVADKPEAMLSIEFLPDFTEREIEDSISARKIAGWETTELLSGSLHNQIGRAVIGRSGGASVKDIVKTIKNFTLPVLGTLGFDYAQVTRGGIDMDGVTDDLESKFVRNLFFAGEILDVDGDCGGYNLQWAFTSGTTVANAILKRI